MHPNPAAGERTTEPSDLLPPRAGAPETGETPRLVLRPKVQWMLAGPVLFALALAVLATGRLRAAPVALVLGLIGIAFLKSWFDRVELGPETVRRRTWLTRETVPLDQVDTLRLRRIAFPWLRWVRRGFKIGRFWSLPLTLRLMRGEDEPLLELRCGWWKGWQGMTRALLALNPELDLDQRTRGRIERYVGSTPLPASFHR
jgi:hypothetical protein